MTAKEKQLFVIKTVLKPLLKEYGYKTQSQTWWKVKGDFYVILDLQNFSWNSKDDINFCFNTGIATRNKVKDPHKPSHYDRDVTIREKYYLPKDRKTHSYHNGTGYLITNDTDLSSFVAALKNDFNVQIISKLEQLQTLDDCLNLYGDLPFGVKILKKSSTHLIIFDIKIKQSYCVLSLLRPSLYSQDVSRI
jgi:hypothetical protein